MRIGAMPFVLPLEFHQVTKEPAIKDSTSPAVLSARCASASFGLATSRSTHALVAKAARAVIANALFSFIGVSLALEVDLEPERPGPEARIVIAIDARNYGGSN